MGDWKGRYNKKQYLQHVAYSEGAAGEKRMGGQLTHHSLHGPPKLGKLEDNYKDKQDSVIVNEPNVMTRQVKYWTQSQSRLSHLLPSSLHTQWIALPTYKL